MSQSGSYNSGSTPPPPGSVETLTGNVGGAVGPDGLGNINTVGDGSVITITGNPGTNTLTTTIATATTSQLGAVELATNAQAIAGTDANNAVTSAALKAKLGVQTAHTVAIGEGTSSALNWSNAGTNGQVFLGATGADPAFATLTSTGGTIVFTPGANSLNLEAAGSGSAITVDADSGSATPVANVLNLNGAVGGNITTSGSGNTLRVKVSGTTNHAVLVGNSTGSINNVGPGTTNTVLLGNTGADPSFGQVPNGALVNSTITVTGDTNITVTGSPVALGGTLGLTFPALTQYDLVTATNTGKVESLPAGTGSAGQVLTSNGAGAYPTWQSATSSSTIVTTFTSSGTFTKNVNTKYISVLGVSAGSGGGSGSCGNSTTAGGGGGGAPGAIFQFMAPASFFNTTSTVLIGAAGSGGASVNAAVPTVGNAGTQGGLTSIGNFCGGSSGVGMLAGAGGNLASNATGGTGGQYTGMMSFNGLGGNSTIIGGGSGTPSAGSAVGSAQFLWAVVTGGGGGAGANSTTANAGGYVQATNFLGTTVATTSTGGIETGTIDGANGQSLTTGTNFIVFGMGGGGGGGQKSGTRGGNGGTGGIGGGGGGGGGSLLNSASGAGGNGGPGWLQVVEFM